MRVTVGVAPAWASLAVRWVDYTCPQQAVTEGSTIHTSETNTCLNISYYIMHGVWAFFFSLCLEQWVIVFPGLITRFYPCAMRILLYAV